MMKNSKYSALASLYKKYFGDLPIDIACLKGDGSDREVYRLFSEKNKTVIGIYGPNLSENEAFVSFSRSFHDINLPVPKILAYDKSRHIYIEDDLGDTTLFDWYESLSTRTKIKSAEKIYKDVLTRLVQFQIHGDRVVDYSKCYQFPAFRLDAIQFDLEYFTNSFLKRFSRIEVDRNLLQNDFSMLTNRLLGEKAAFFLYRDFQSRNIMMRDEKLYFIDYQSGRKGALQYDLASLLFDANLTLDNALRDSLLDYYIDLISEQIKIDRTEFKAYYFDFALIRMLQALAAFSHLAIDKGKIYFMNNIPRALANISTLLQKGCILNELSEIKRVFVDDVLINPKFKVKGF